jgi:Flp pilus assembly protein TadG
VTTRRLCDLARDSAGAALVEFTIVLPLLIAVVFGASQFGSLLNNYMIIMDATDVGATRFATTLVRKSTIPVTDTQNQIYDWASSLCGSGSLPSCSSVLTIGFSVNGTPCTTDSGCLSQLNSPAPKGQKGNPVSVSVSYPCNLWPGIASLMSFGSCALSSTLTARVW